MDRLTERDEYGNADIIGVDSGDLQLNLAFDEFNRVTDALNRLAAYEDTGLTPEQAATYAKAEIEGRLIVLPCKVGDTVYRPSKEKGEVWEWEIVEARYYGADGDFNDQIEFVDDSENYFFASQIGKTVFTSREAAEAALKEAQG